MPRKSLSMMMANNTTSIASRPYWSGVP